MDIESGGETGKRKVAFDFHPVEGRRFVTVSVNIEADDLDPTATVLKAITGQAESLPGAIVRLSLTLPAQVEGQLRDGDIRDALKETYYFTIAREIQREARLRLGSHAAAEEITPLEALKAYLESKKVSPERTKVLLEYGERLIRGE